jgi:hypothetical protein
MLGQLGVGQVVECKGARLSMAGAQVAEKIRNRAQLPAQVLGGEAMVMLQDHGSGLPCYHQVCFVGNQ